MSNAKKGITSDVKLIRKIKQTIILISMKFREEREELEERLQAGIKETIVTKVDGVLRNMNKLKEAIKIDMKKWKTQRADLQIEINKIDNKVDYKRDEGLFILNEEANQFDHAFGLNMDENQDSRRGLTQMTNAETFMGGPPSFLTMMEKQNMLNKEGKQLKQNNTSSALSPNYFHGRPNSLDGVIEPIRRESGTGNNSGRGMSEL